MGRPTTKANPILFCLRKDLDAFLRREANRTGMTMVRVVERMLEERRALKP